MTDDLRKRRRDKKLQLAGDQLREILSAGNVLKRREACDHILDKAGEVKQDLDFLLTQLAVLAKVAKHEDRAEKIKKLMVEVDLEMLAMETIFESFPEDWTDVE